MISFWIDYGTNYIGGTGDGQTDAAWLIPLALQLVPAVILGVGMVRRDLGQSFIFVTNKIRSLCRSVQDGWFTMDERPKPGKRLLVCEASLKTMNSSSLSSWKFEHSPCLRSAPPPSAFRILLTERLGKYTHLNGLGTAS